MNIVCLSALDVSSEYIVRRVVTEFPQTKLIRVRGVPARSAWTKRLRNFVRGGWLRRLEERLFYQQYYEYRSKRIRQLLGPFGDSPLPFAAEITSKEANCEATAALLRSFEPDVLLVVSGPLLKPHIFEIPRLAAINVHFGISPAYRGEHTLFWPLYYRDYQNIGMTFHLIDHGIDTGKVLAHIFIEVTGEDSEWSVEAKAVQAAAPALIDLLRRGEIAPLPRAPSSPGRHFNFKSRRVWHDGLFWARRRWSVGRQR